MTPLLGWIAFTYFFLGAIMGHLVGDYLLQNQWMALNKSKPGWKGVLACTIHVLLYTSAVSLFSGLHGLVWLVGVAIPHYLIDRYSLGQKLLNLKNRAEEVWAPQGRAWAPEKGTTENVWQIAFAAPVYIANDNTLHLLCLWVLLKLALAGLV